MYATMRTFTILNTVLGRAMAPVNQFGHNRSFVSWRKNGKGRIAVIEILKSTMRTRDYVEKGEGEGKTLLDAMRDGNNDGMQHFDGEMESDSLGRDRLGNRNDLCDQCGKPTAGTYRLLEPQSEEKAYGNAARSPAELELTS